MSKDFLPSDEDYFFVRDAREPQAAETALREAAQAVIDAIEPIPLAPGMRLTPRVGVHSEVIDRLRAALASPESRSLDEAVGRVLASYHSGSLDGEAMRDMGMAFDARYPTYWDDRRLREHSETPR